MTAISIFSLPAMKEAVLAFTVMALAVGALHNAGRPSSVSSSVTMIVLSFPFPVIPIAPITPVAIALSEGCSCHLS